jgi:transposase InsO family protein
LHHGAVRQAARPWLTVILDDYSRAVAGYMVFLGAPSSLHTSLALRQAIWRKQNPSWPVHGIPDVGRIGFDRAKRGYNRLIKMVRYLFQ